jgi:DNA topoisomerase-2
MQHTESSVKFIIKMKKEMMDAAKEVGLYKKFKLETQINTSNMILFDEKGNLKRYSSPLEVIEDFYVVRKRFYEKRKVHLTSVSN